MSAMYPCTRCNKNVSFKDVRYKNNGKDLICVECHEAVIKKQLVSEKPQEAQTTTAGNIVKDKYICTKCRYKFVYKPSSADLKCPYCSCPEVLKDDYNAEKLLQEATGYD
jgi:predicted SprT family Zn-dependent metalloprotease